MVTQVDIIVMSQPWSSKFLRQQAELMKEEAAVNLGRNWHYSACRNLAAMDGLMLLAQMLDGGCVHKTDYTLVPEAKVINPKTDK